MPTKNVKGHALPRFGQAGQKQSQPKGKGGVNTSAGGAIGQAGGRTFSKPQFGAPGQRLAGGSGKGSGKTIAYRKGQ